MSTERTIIEGSKTYGSAPNLNLGREKQATVDKWVQSKRNKKRLVDDSDSDSSRNPESVWPDISGRNAAQINKNLVSLQEQMTAMTNVLTSLKEDQDARFKHIQADMLDIKNQITEVKKTYQDIEKSVEFLSAQCEDLEKSRKVYAEESKKNQNKMKELLQKNIYFEKCNKALEERIMKMEQKELELNIELVNVQTIEKENVMETVKKMAEELKLPSEDIEKARRMPGDSSKAPRPIVVTFRSNKSREDWLKCKKQIITNHRVLKNGDNTRIYINENLTRQMRQLFWIAKMKLKDTYKFIWIQNSRILIKRNEIEKKIYQINFESDIETLLAKDKEQNRE